METNTERKNAILKLREEGKTYGEIVKALNCTKSLVSFYCGKRFDPVKDAMKEAARLEYEHIVCDVVSKSKNINEVCRALGKRGTNKNYDFVKKIIEKYNLSTAHFTTEYNSERKEFFSRYSDSEVYCENSQLKNTNSLRKRLLKDGIKEHKCECCGNTEWMGVPIPLQVHHVNGNNRDNRIENLQMLCPTCHALTDTYCGRSKKRKEKTQNIKESKIPSTDALIKAFLEEKKFTAVGKKFGVSDNAVRKWCSKLELPVSSKKMKAFLEKYKF